MKTQKYNNKSDKTLRAFMEHPNLGTGSLCVCLRNGGHDAGIEIKLVTDVTAELGTKGAGCVKKLKLCASCNPRIAETIDADTGELELQTTEMVWEVRGYYLDAEINHQERDFCFRCRNVVLACGTSDKPNRLQVCGEDLSYVNHHVPNMEEFMKNVNSMDSDPVLVIGAGLSAADAILTAKQFKLNVIHLFRQSLRQQKNRLPKSIYPDYNYMYELMSGTEKADWYKSYSNHSVRCFLRNNKVLLEDDSGHMEIIEVSAVLVQIGSTVNFDFLSDQGRNIGIVPGMTIDAKHNRIDINPYTHECNTVQGLYALGPLVGDNFVRFLKGGALAITKHILMKNGVISM